MTIVWTADQVCITDGLRVWVLPRAEPGLYVWVLPHEPGTVDLTTTRTEVGRDSMVQVDLDFGRSVIVPAATLAACHPCTGHRPPGLGICRWVGTCVEPAVRMVAHPLMSPVPTCELHHPEQRRVEQFQRVDHAEHQRVDHAEHE